MGLRFRKSLRIAPGVRVNLGTRGPSVSLGGRGFTTTISTRGTRNTVSFPGTGLSYSTWSPANPPRRGKGTLPMPARRLTATAPPITVPVRRVAAVMGLAVVAILVVAVVPGLVAIAALGGAGALVWVLHRSRGASRHASLARRWAAVRHAPQDPAYAALLAEWYGSGITDAERKANSVP